MGGCHRRRHTFLLRASKGRKSFSNAQQRGTLKRPRRQMIHGKKAFPGVGRASRLECKLQRCRTAADPDEAAPILGEILLAKGRLRASLGPQTIGNAQWPFEGMSRPEGTAIFPPSTSVSGLAAPKPHVFRLRSQGRERARMAAARLATVVLWLPSRCCRRMALPGCPFPG